MDDYGITLEELEAAAADNSAVYGDAKGNVWNGQGEPPEWLRAAKNAGASPEFFRLRTDTALVDRTADSLLNSAFFRL